MNKKDIHQNSQNNRNNSRSGLLAKKRRMVASMAACFLISGSSELKAATLDDQDSAIRVYRELCSSDQAEGMYDVTADELGRLHINIFCTSQQTLVASIHRSDGSRNFSLVHTAVDGDIISFVTFHPDADDAKTMPPNNTDMRLRLNIPLLKKGSLKGTIRTLHHLDPEEIEATRRTISFPNLLNRASGQKPLEGSYSFKDDKLTGVVSIEVIGGIQRVNIHIPEIGGRVLYHGLPAKEAGGIVYATTGVDDGMFGGIGLIHLRARIINDKEIDLYYFDARRDLIGPLRGIKRTISN